MNIIRSFSEISKSDTEIAGGKGASLGEMTRIGIPVPSGFVILAEAFEKFLEETDLGAEIDAILGTVNKDEMRSVEHASEKIQSLILRAKMSEDIEGVIYDNYKKLDSKYVAVRSSATAEDSSSAAWAGQLESFLNTTEADLLEKVQHCWASLFTPRAIFYRFEKELHTTKISVAVVVQKMVNSEISGIAFSVHPVTEDRNQLIIEAGLGLGEAIVSGSITPDSYVVKKDTKEIIDINVSIQTKALYRVEGGGSEWRNLSEEEASAQVLTENQIQELSKIIITIEDHYGFPCDIEWALEDGKFYIVQSRPITTLNAQLDNKKKITLSKYMSREHSLFYAYVWNESNRDWFDEYISSTNIKNMLFARNEQGILEIFFDLKELDKIFNKIGDEVIRDPKILDKVIDDHDFFWKKLTPYVIQKQKIQTIEELNEYYNNWIRWWAPMAYVFILPEVEKVPKDLRAKALKVREETQEYSDIGDDVYVNFIKEKYPQFSDVANLLTPEEVWQLDSLSEEDVYIVKDRSKGYSIATIDGVSIFGFSDDIRHKLEDKNIGFEEVLVSDEKEIKGNTAYGGRVSGVVKIVRKVEEINKINDGDILVTPMTDPRYVVSMKKAAAIVTDEGGVTCHSAIVARELKKPCIIGTKFATQVLKDGDLVEVDADNGVVKILESENDKSSDESSFNPADIKWHKLMERKNLFFVGLGFADIESAEFKKLMGFELKYFLFKFEKGNWSTYKSDTEFEDLYKHISNLVKSGDGRFFGLAQKGVEYNEKGREYIDKHASNPTEPTIDNFNYEYKLYCNILLYGITIPWDVIGAIETLSKSEQEKYKPILDVFEPLRAVSLYLDYEKEVLQKYRTFLSKKYNIEVSLLNLLTPQELRQALVGKFVPDVDLLEKRRDYCVFWLNLENKEIEFTYDSSIESKIPALQNIKVEKSDVIKGTIAYRGLANGRVRVVYEQEDCKTFEEGEILVSPSTNPSLMAAIKKCAGIITDEGGMTSHAAIIARELKKPAVIGTKVATHVLSDGDLVEVDADNGVVRVLEEAKLDLNDYVRLFAFDGAIPFLFSCQFTEAADWLNYLALGDENSWISYMKKDSIGRANKEGLELYSSIENYNKFSDGLYETNDLIRKLTVEITNKQDISESQLENFFELLEKYRWHYTRTEFFFTDLAFERKDEFPDVIKNFETFEKLKIDGRQYLNEIFLIPNACLAQVLNILGKKFQLSIDELNRYSPVEIKKLFLGNKLSDKVIQERAVYVHYMKDRGVVTICGDEAVSIIKSLKQNREVEELRGKTAYGGKVKAKARVITVDVRDYDKIHEFVDEMQDGEVLVAETTEPSIIMACKKASAIVTNQGGMMSHAAITARELKIPCIVGTSVATNIVKTGDLVEVDADSGIITIIEKTKESLLYNNTLSTDSFDVSEYSRLFRLQGVRFFINDMYARVYPDYGFIILIKDGDYISYMKHSGIKKAHEEGKVLLLDKNGEFQEYKKSIDFHWEQVAKFHESIKTLEVVTREQVNTYIDICGKSLELYKYTEFIFTEYAFEVAELENNDKLKENVLKMGDIKNESRSHMNLLFLGDKCTTHIILSLLSKQFDIPVTDLLEYGELELKELFDGYKITKNIIKERQQGSVIENKNGELGYMWGTQAINVFDKFTLSDEKQNGLIKGVTANSGKVVGRVYVLSSGYDNFTTLSQYIDKMNKGDVLVSETTSPDLIAACKKASAIVTNQGGMMSHAAIVSRELKIPCIVGTENATQVLRTGDLVEVDADNGVVWVIEKSS